MFSVVSLASLSESDLSQVTRRSLHMTDMTSLNMYILFQSEGYDSLTESFECRRYGASMLEASDARDLSRNLRNLVTVSKINPLTVRRDYLAILLSGP